MQLRRAGVGSLLIDPVPLPDLSALGEVIADVEWVLHAASQDLPCLAELGLRPTQIFDTELAGRLLGYARVGLGSIIEEVLGYTLEKGHSAADWSTRPLPEPWLRYAALDVELLVELRDVLEAQLTEQGKRDWAAQEFAAIAAAPPAPPRVEPWRRTSGLHRLRKRRQLAVVRALWEARDDLARRRDIAPGRVLPDAAIAAAALALPKTEAELLAVSVFNGRSLRRSVATWFAAVDAALHLPEDDLPDLKARYDGPPPARSWPERDPEAAARLAAGRAAVAAIADRAQPADREPAGARLHPPARLVAARRRHRTGGRRRTARSGCPAVAGAAHRGGAGRGAGLAGGSRRGAVRTCRRARRSG